jgi:hypothetical protein
MTKIASVGFSYPDDDVEHLEYLSDRSVLDADIIVFEPRLPPGYGDTRQFHEGKRILTENASFRVKQAAAHWRNELDVALVEGKTVIVFPGSGRGTEARYRTVHVFRNWPEPRYHSDRRGFLPVLGRSGCHR